MVNRIGRPKWEIKRTMTPIKIYPILREYIEVTGREYTDHITGLLISDLERFINTDHNGQEPDYHEFKERARQDLITINEFRSQIKMQKEARYLKNPPSADEETQALDTFIRGLIPIQQRKLKSICMDYKLDDLIPYQEACEKKTGVWVRPVIFLRKYPPREIEPE